MAVSFIYGRLLASVALADRRASMQDPPGQSVREAVAWPLLGASILQLSSNHFFGFIYLAVSVVPVSKV